ncbi:MAG: glutamyl-tRNA(Gln) amidotransferase subunit E [Ignavibacteria bacterium GWB2_35_12]|nr:MAG: glutamyl-tRNA(Gln) amidotransferase subunit E [Ignavibacteria bacterium GWA2_35_8]OGU41864.1 MAG: glutamyl-tRNA(Gln) amidotransferase subunit E [Ignavibacteria bacterium GWB2_35_12]OGU86157.1 MAG: glutamyl-tRNA(Gln) amidotransferase subunit E [Ignavibacteria bacterium RIFOXYA2_FULL_35_10]OGV23488.1 MAG: glutamyl-tRNA(Gln) amidotransferase subunit E [Ignavibacteria bacterium RIFOXYC2_FULL_35_21]
MGIYDFEFKTFEEMTTGDYERVGFMSGLEVHQQLMTDLKLFCRCPAGIYSKEYDAEILRHMRPTLSELGEYDGTALMEFKTKKDIIYRIQHDTVCTYEMDDTPPFQINEQALDIALEISMLTKAKIVDEMHIARKQYLDGSIPTGFQRTAIVSVGGAVPYKDREIRLIQMSIEEDSCREAGDVGHKRTYLTDRLGMPLIETVTYPDMKTPVEVAEVNDILRRLARCTGKVRIGVGAGREDVNVSVTGGTRIEIKGVPSIKRIPLLTYNEAMRQWNLLRLREELHNRGITKDTFESRIDDVTKLLNKTNYQPINKAIEEGQTVKCVTLKGFKGLLSWQTQTDTYFSKEISDRVRVIACLTTLPNIIHSDSYENTLSTSEGLKIRRTVGAKDDDTLVIVWGNQADAELGANEIIIRAKEATIGIPSETRQALRDGTNGFERILPGPDRMYPDTDLPPKRITKERRDKIRMQIPKPYWENETWYYQIGVPKDLIRDLSGSRFANLFETCVREWKLEPKTVATALIQFPKRLKKKKLDISLIGVDEFNKIFEALKDKKIVKDSILDLLERVIRNGGFTEDLMLKPSQKNELKSVYSQVKKEIKDIKLMNEEQKEKIMIGMMMNHLRSRVNGITITEFVREQQKGANS